MPAFLAFIPAWAWRWIAIGAVAASAGFMCWHKGYESCKADWDASVAQQRADAAKLQAIQDKGFAAAKARHDAGVTDDDKNRADVHAAVDRACGVLPAGVQLPAKRSGGQGMPAIRPGVPEAAAGPAFTADDIKFNLDAGQACYRQLNWVIDQAIAAGADKD